MKKSEILSAFVYIRNGFLSFKKRKKRFFLLQRQNKILVFCWLKRLPNHLICFYTSNNGTRTSVRWEPRVLIVAVAPPISLSVEPFNYKHHLVLILFRFFIIKRDSSDCINIICCSPYSKLQSNPHNYYFPSALDITPN